MLERTAWNGKDEKFFKMLKGSWFSEKTHLRIVYDCCSYKLTAVKGMCCILAGYQVRENESAAQHYFSASDLGGAEVGGNPNWPIFTFLWEVLQVVTIGKQSANDRCMSTSKTERLTVSALSQESSFIPGLGTPYLSWFFPSLGSLLFCVPLQFHFSHFICCSQGLRCLVSTLMKSPSILLPSLRMKRESLEQGPSSVYLKQEQLPPPLVLSVAWVSSTSTQATCFGCLEEISIYLLCCV